MFRRSGCSRGSSSVANSSAVAKGFWTRWRDTLFPNTNTTAAGPASTATSGTSSSSTFLPGGDAFAVVEAAMLNRRSCKQYDPNHTVDPALLGRILDATIRSPTAFNLQGWTAVVVLNDKQFLAEAGYAKKLAAGSNSSSLATSHRQQGGSGTASLINPRNSSPTPIESEQASGVYSVLRETGASNAFLDGILKEEAERRTQSPKTVTTRSSTPQEDVHNTDALLRAKLQEVHAKVKLAALGQPSVAMAPITVIFAGNMEPVENAPAVLEAGIDTGYFREVFGAQYLRHVYYMLHGGPANVFGVAKNTLSGWYSHHTGSALLTVPSSKQAYAWKQTMIPATNFVTLCNSAGLSTLTLEGIDEGAMMAAVGLDTNKYTVPCIVTIGFPAVEADGSVSPRAHHPTMSPRFKRDQFIHLGTFGASTK